MAQGTEQEFQQKDPPTAISSGVAKAMGRRDKKISNTAIRECILSFCKSGTYSKESREDRLSHISL